MGIWCGEDVAVGAGPDKDRSEAVAERNATLALLGIAPLSPYDSAMMTKRRRGWQGPTPRKDARENGVLYYFSHRPCKRGHFSKRLVSSGVCIACQDIWRHVNRDRVREINREYQRRTYRPRKRAKQA